MSTNGSWIYPADRRTHQKPLEFSGAGQGGSISGGSPLTLELDLPRFAAGTLIATPQGARAVEDLRVGDRVLTRDNGNRAIRWIARHDISRDRMKAEKNLRPVLIRKGAFGPEQPGDDILLSPHHRILMANERTSYYFEEREVLVAIRHMVDGETIVRQPPRDLTYVAFVCDEHQIVLANGVWCETCALDPTNVAGMDEVPRRAGHGRLALSDVAEGMVPQRKTLVEHEAALLR